MPDKTTPVVHNTADHRFEIVEDGLIAEAHYSPVAGAWIMDHTVVPPEWEGRGIASSLVTAAVKVARVDGLKIIPTCSYVIAWLKRHRGERDLVPDEIRASLGL